MVENKRIKTEVREAFVEPSVGLRITLEVRVVDQEDRRRSVSNQQTCERGGNNKN